MLFSPSHGLLVRGWRRLHLARRLLADHLLVGLYRESEASEAPPVAADWLRRHFGHERRAPAQLRALARQGLVDMRGEGRVSLTESGREAAAGLLRGHRLWETYLHERVGLPADHLHPPADAVEHYLSPDLQQALSQSLAHPDRDPTGKPIP